LIDRNLTQRLVAITSDSTRAWLACGVVAGPLYVSVTMVQALTREGFDLKHHRFTLLTTGDLGWIHQLNMIVVGALTMLFAIGVSQVLASGRGAVWAPRMLGAVGLAYLFGGLFVADPIVGFPPGTTAEMSQKTWQGIIQNGSRGASTLALLVTSVIIAQWFYARGYRGWAWFYGAGFPTMFVTLSLVGMAIGFNGGGLAFLVTPWIWISTLAVHLYSREVTSDKQAAF
jgi:Protein of unknown function (DUF998)